MAGYKIRVHDFAIGDRTNLIEWFAICISMHWFDVDSFMKSRINYPTDVSVGSRTKPY